MSNKIGVGIITCNRENFFHKCLNSIPQVDELITVNDGNKYSSYGKCENVIEHENNKCVGISKNEALRFLIDKGCDHLFLIEDDMVIKNQEVFEKYIHTAEESGIWHLNFAYHGNGNVKNGIPNPLLKIKYKNESISLNTNCVGSFSYYYKGVIRQVGYIDEFFTNCWDHVEHTYRIIRSGLHPPFWAFADVSNSYDYIGELGSVESSSIIRKSDEWNLFMKEGIIYFKLKYGIAPLEIPVPTKEKIEESLKKIRNNYARKI